VLLLPEAEQLISPVSVGTSEIPIPWLKKRKENAFRDF
jgi:hypothetical protein